MLFSHHKRLFELWRIAAKYRLDTHLPLNDVPQLKPIARLIRSHPIALVNRHKELGVKLALEEMGTLFLKLGQLLSTRRDLVTPEVIEQLVLLQDKVKPFSVTTVIEQIEESKNGLGISVNDYFLRFDKKPLAAASIAQVHTAALPDGREVVVKVTRPDIKVTIVNDFELLRDLARWASDRIEAARAIHIIDIVENYRQIMLNELDLTLEASNATKMRENFIDSSMMYVPEVYDFNTNVMVSERVHGVPISYTDVFDDLGYNRAELARKGLTIFFTQVFRDNFFHADMHPGNVFVETAITNNTQGTIVSKLINPRYIGLDCAIMGQLSKEDQLIIARILLSVMNNNFTGLVDIIYRAGWIPPSTDKHTLMRDMSRAISPMLNKSIKEIEFASVLIQILDIARRHHMSIPPQLMLLLKTLVHVEGLGRDLYPDLDIWSLAKPILTSWIKEQLNPVSNLKQLKEQLPEILLSSTDLPRLIDKSLQGLAEQGSRQEQQLREIQQLRSDLLNEKKHDWLVLLGVAISIGIATQVGWFAPIFYFIAIIFTIWRIIR